MTSQDEALGEPFRIRREQEDGVTWIRLFGALGQECLAELNSEFRHALEGNASRLVLDLRGLTFIDSAGLQMIFDEHTRCQEKGCSLLVVRGHGQVDRVFSLTGAEQGLELVDDPSAI